MKITAEKLFKKQEGGMYEQTIALDGSPAELLLIDEALYNQGFVARHHKNRLVVSTFIKQVEDHEILINLVRSVTSDIQLIPGLIGALDRIMEQPALIGRIDAVFAGASNGNGNGNGNGHPAVVPPSNGNGHNGHQ